MERIEEVELHTIVRIFNRVEKIVFVYLWLLDFYSYSGFNSVTEFQWIKMKIKAVLKISRKNVEEFHDHKKINLFGELHKIFIFCHKQRSMQNYLKIAKNIVKNFMTFIHNFSIKIKVQCIRWYFRCIFYSLLVIFSHENIT